MLRTMLAQHRWRLAACGALCALAAALNVFLLDFLHEVAQTAQARALRDWLPTYALAALLLFGVSLLANISLVSLACRLVAELRESLVRQILATRYAQLERTGKGPLLATLTDDVANISEGMVIAPQFLLNAIIIVLCLGYLMHLSWAPFVYFFAALLAGIALTLLIIQRGNYFMERYRELKDRFYAHLHALIDGSKELAVSGKRRRHFCVQEVLPAIEELKSAEYRREIYWNIGENWARIFLFGALAVAVVVTRTVASEAPALTMTYFIVITFLAGPIEFVVNACSSLAKAGISARAVARLNLGPAQPQPESTSSAIPEQWQEIQFEAVTFTAQCEDARESFRFGPVSLTIRRGEILFITGGNGSGKSTFGKLLVGLYQHQGGTIRVDDVIVTPEQIAAYQELFATVFSDYYLFASLLDLRGEAAGDDAVRAGLQKLGLAHEVGVSGGRLSTTALSQGQRKRLALLQAWLQDKPVCLLDEWAADQDAGFREEFYRHIVPAMRRAGKTLVIISHDDRYFDEADRICKFELGQIAEITAAEVLPLSGNADGRSRTAAGAVGA